jgi:hypothetical protein
VRIPVARLGTFVHKRYGIVHFSDSDFADMVRNFEENECGFTPYLRYGHAAHPEAVDGEPKIANLLRLEKEGDVLYGVYDPIAGCEKVVQEVKNGEYEFSSAELTRHAISKRDGRPIGTLLTAHALTNAPFVPDLPRNQALSEGADGTPSNGFMRLNLSNEGALTMNPDEILSMIDAAMGAESLSINADQRAALRARLAGSLSAPGAADVSTKTAGQPGTVYSETKGKESPKQNESGMDTDQKPSADSQSVNKPAGKPSEVYTGAGAEGGTTEMHGHGAPLHQAAKNLDKMGDNEDRESMSSMMGEFLSMVGNFMKGKKGAKPGDDKSAPKDEKHSQTAGDSNPAQNVNGGTVTIDNSKTGAGSSAQEFSNTEGEIDMKPTEVQALIASAVAEAVGAVKQEFSTQLAEKDQKIEGLQTQLTTTVAVQQQFTQNAERSRVQQRAEALVSAGIAPTTVNAVLALASNPELAGRQIKLSEGAAPVSLVDSLLDVLEQTPAENRVNYTQVGQQLSDSDPNPYAEIISRVETVGK